MNKREIINDILELKKMWAIRNSKFREWYDLLLLKDKLKTPGMESVVVNEPRTFFNMAHYLLTTGNIRHEIPVLSDSPVELDKQAKVSRACQYMWRLIDEERQHGGLSSFVSELGFYLLALGWACLVMAFDRDAAKLIVRLWSPINTYPRFEDNQLITCVHEYFLSVRTARRKAIMNNWNYRPKTDTGKVKLSDYFFLDDDGMLQNIILIDDEDVTGIVCRDDMKLLVLPVGGFPDRGSLEPVNWSELLGQSILETNRVAYEDLNKWETFIAQIMRDTAQTKWQEFAATPKATPEQLRQRGALFHYSPGEQGLVPVPIPPIPLEIRAALMDKYKRIQKGAFSDAVFGMVERGMAGYILSMLAGSSANQILFPYMQAKHYVISECDKFWLRHLKQSKRVFEIKSKFIEKLSPPDIPEDVDINVESELATQRDWLEKATIANMLKEHLDSTTILSEVLGIPDTEGVRKRKNLDLLITHPVSRNLNLIEAYYAHADLLDMQGERRHAMLYRKAAQALEAQLGIPPPGAAKPIEEAEVIEARRAGAPEERLRVSPEVAPPEALRGFTPAEIRAMIGRGTLEGV